MNINDVVEGIPIDVQIQEQVPTGPSPKAIEYAGKRLEDVEHYSSLVQEAITDCVEGLFARNRKQPYASAWNEVYAYLRKHPHASVAQATEYWYSQQTRTDPRE